MVSGPAGRHRKVRGSLDGTVATTESESAQELDRGIRADAERDQARQRETNPRCEH